MLFVNGLILSQAIGAQTDQNQRVGIFSLGSIQQLDFTPGHQSPLFPALQEREIMII